ncbi:unnamed protein product [Caenorhabditis brenneri]
MDPLNVFPNQRELLNAIPVGGGGRNEMKDPSTLEPGTFGARFVNLPDVAFENCLDFLPVSEQILLSVFEDSMREKIRNLRRNDVVIDVVLGSNMACVQLTTKKAKGEVYLVKGSDYSRGPYGAVYGDGESEENIRMFSIHQEQFEIKGELVRVFHCHQVCNDIKFFVEHLESVFHGKLNSVRLDVQYGESCSRINPKLTECEKIMIPPTVSIDTFNELADEFRAQTMVIRKDTYDDSGYAIQMKDLDLLECRVISFCQSQFEAVHYNQIIKNWMNGSYGKTEVLVFWVCDWDVDYRGRLRTDPVVVMHGIEHSAVGKTALQTIMENAANSRKVQRSDGRFAVITTEGLQNGRMFHFRLIVLNDDGLEPECSIAEEYIAPFDWPIKVREPHF